MGSIQKRYINRPENAAKKLPMLEEMLSFADLPAGGKALEVGCGPGYMSHALFERGFDVTGTDLDPGEIEFASRGAPAGGPAFLEADATELPFENARFDLVLSMMVLHHMRDWRNAIAEAARVLKPGGYFLINEHTYSAFLKVAGRLFLRGHSFFRIEEVSAELEGQGMQTVWMSPPHRYLYNQFTEYNIVYRRS